MLAFYHFCPGEHKQCREVMQEQQALVVVGGTVGGKKLTAPTCDCCHGLDHFAWGAAASTQAPLSTSQFRFSCHLGAHCLGSGKSNSGCSRNC